MYYQLFHFTLVCLKASGTFSAQVISHMVAGFSCCFKCLYRPFNVFLNNVTWQLKCWATTKSIIGWRLVPALKVHLKCNFAKRTDFIWTTKSQRKKLYVPLSSILPTFESQMKHMLSAAWSILSHSSTNLYVCYARKPFFYVFFGYICTSDSKTLLKANTFFYNP